MSMETAKKPLQIRSDCVSTFRPVQLETDAPDLIEKTLTDIIPADAVMVIWQMNKVVWGRWQAGRITLAPNEQLQTELWQEVRVFNENEELHLRRAGKGFLGRHRKDGPTEQGGIPYVDSFSRFWGKADDAREDGYATLIDESRKLRLVIPVEKESADRYGLETRNYIGSDEETGLSGYVDYRFVHIAGIKEGK